MKGKASLVKICGITTPEDARWAANFGADFIGVNLYKESPRKVSLDKAKEIIESLPSFVKSVALFVNPEINDIQNFYKTTKAPIVQLHGDETPAFIAEVKLKFQCAVWKAIRVENEASLAKIDPYLEVADVILLDAYVPDQFGGTGQTFDWNLALPAKSKGKPIILSGGLKPDNVQSAIQTVEPFAVDTASGVEKTDHPRKKDVEKMKLFIQKAKGMA